MFRIRPEDVPGFRLKSPEEEEVPGFRVKSPEEEEVPGFRMNADGSVREAGMPAMQSISGSGNIPFGLPDWLGSYDNAFASSSDGPLSPNPMFGSLPYDQVGASSLFGGDLTAKANSPFVPYQSSNFSPLPSLASVNYGADPSSTPAQRSPSPWLGSVPDQLQSAPNVMRLGSGSSGEPPASARANDPNIVRVVDGEPVKAIDDIQIAQQQSTPQAGLRKDLSSGEIVVLPDRLTIPDAQSPTGQLMAPKADLSDVAAAGREARERLRALNGNPLARLAYLTMTLGANVGHGGTFDYQRQGNMITGYTHLKQFEKVSNLNVGLFAQQAGLPLEHVLGIAGEFARNFSSNADPKAPYGLNPAQREFITLGYKIGESGMFERPPMP